MADLDLTDVILLLQAALTVARQLDGNPAILDREVKENRAAAAETNRQLNVLTHYCERAAIEASAVLFVMKGFPDPLRSDQQ